MDGPEIGYTETVDGVDIAPRSSVMGRPTLVRSHGEVSNVDVHRRWESAFGR